MLQMNPTLRVLLLHLSRMPQAVVMDWQLIILEIMRDSLLLLLA
jgi:hypothetical protein